MGFADIPGLTTAAGTLHRTAKSVQHTSQPVGTQAAAAPGHEELARALHRFGATWSTSLSDTSTQLDAAAFLAPQLSV